MFKKDGGDAVRTSTFVDIEFLDNGTYFGAINRDKLKGVRGPGWKEFGIVFLISIVFPFI